ncbi:MAG: DUF1156 domain-containing protein, partial [Acetobacteraceae bacterium]|nr:DUF1156 domain-containing protein [Acetobacteraceae bacterium]
MKTLVAPTPSGLAPFSLKDAPALIERVFPAQKIGIEAQKERKAGSGQTLPTLGSYWKGRKPLVLVRACVLASLLPATDDPDADLDLFEALMAMDEQGLAGRGAQITAADVAACSAIPRSEWEPHIELQPSTGPGETDAGRTAWRPVMVDHISDPARRQAARLRIEKERDALRSRAFAAMPFAQRIAKCERTERVEALRDPDHPLYAAVLEKANARLGTTARTIPELVAQL